MIRDFQKLFKHTAVYGLGGVANRVTSFLLLPVYTYYLTTTDYGVLEILNVFSRFLNILLLLGLPSAVFKSTLYDPEDKRTAVSTAFYALTLFSGLITGLLALFAPTLAQVFLGDSALSHYFVLTLAAMWVRTISTIPMVRLRVEEQSGAYAFLNWFIVVVTFTSDLYFMVVLKAGLGGLVLSSLVSASITGLVCLLTLLRHLVFKFSPRLLGSMLAFGLPLVLVRGSTTILDVADRFFLKQYATLAQVGLYSLGYKFGMIIILVVDSLQLAWPALMFQRARQPGAAAFFSRVLTYYLLGTAFLGLAISLLAQDAIRIMAREEFHAAYTVVPLICAAYTAYGVFYVTAVGVNLKSKNHQLIGIAVASAALHLLQNWILIPRFGMMGAGVSTAISYVTFGVLACMVSLRSYSIDYQYRRIGWLLGLAVIFYLVGSAVQVENVVLSVGLRSMFVAAFPVGLYLTGFFTPPELAAARAVAVNVWHQCVAKWPKRHS